MVLGREGGQGGGRNARCHSLPARTRTTTGAFQGHATGERYHFGDPVSWPKISREKKKKKKRLIVGVENWEEHNHVSSFRPFHLKRRNLDKLHFLIFIEDQFCVKFLSSN